MIYDAIIIGGALSGSRTAELLAKKGHKVLLIEEHSYIGEPCKCTGLASWRTPDMVKLPKEIIVNRVDMANFYAPDGNFFTLKSKKQIYVLDRPGLDRFLFNSAVEAGADARTSETFERFWYNNGMVSIKTNKGTYDAKILVGADGGNSLVAKQANLEMPKNFFSGLQTTAEGDFENVELWFGSKLCPKFFGWIVPENEHTARVGIAAEKNPNLYYQNFLRKRVKSFRNPNVAGVIRFGVMKDTASDRILLVGDAACQMKPLSISGDEAVIVRVNNFIRNEKIEEVVNFAPFKAQKLIGYGNEYNVFNLNGKVHTFSMTKDADKVAFYEVKNVLSHKLEESLYEIITEKGYRIKTTGSHSVIVMNSSGIVSKEVSKLDKDKDYLLCTLDVPNNETLTKINLIELIMQEAPELVPNVRVRGGKKLIYSKRSDIPLKLRSAYWDNDSIPLKLFLDKSIVPDDVKITFEPAKKSVKIPNLIEVTPEFCRLLGYYAAEGSCHDERDIAMAFGGNDKKLGYVDDFLECIKKVFSIDTVKVRSNKNPLTGEINGYSFSFGGYLLTRIFSKVFKCGKDAHSKQVPFIIFNVKNEIKKEFLKGYLRGDGSIRIRMKGNRRNWSADIGAKSVSRKLIDDLTFLSLQLELLPSIEEFESKERILFGKNIKKSKGYKISFSSKSDLSILSGVFLHKKKLLLTYLGKITSRSVVNLPRKVLPDYLLKMFSKAMHDEYGSYSAYHSFDYFRLEKVLKKVGINNATINLIKNLVRNKILVAPIKEIRREDTNNAEVYDLEVPETNTFIGGIGPIVLHNSGGGITYGLVGAQFAADACNKALEENKFSYRFFKEEYDERWKERLSSGIKKGLFYRNLLFNMSDSHINVAFKLISTFGYRFLERLDFDLLLS